jgi:hypothetical protein
MVENNQIDPVEELDLAESEENQAKVYSRDVYAKKEFWNERFTE